MIQMNEVIRDLKAGISERDVLDEERTVTFSSVINALRSTVTIAVSFILFIKFFKSFNSISLSISSNTPF